MNYQKEFVNQFELGIKIPSYFQDTSYRHDIGPSFRYEHGDKRLVLWVKPEGFEDRELELDYRYTILDQFKGESGWHYDHLYWATDNPEKVEALIADRGRLHEMMV